MHCTLYAIYRYSSGSIYPRAFVDADCFSELLPLVITPSSFVIKIQTFKKYEMSCAKCQPYCVSLCVFAMHSNEEALTRDMYQDHIFVCSSFLEFIFNQFENGSIHWLCSVIWLLTSQTFRLVPDSKVHGVNIGPHWVMSAPDGPHVGSMTLAIRGVIWGYINTHPCR